MNKALSAVFITMLFLLAGVSRSDAVSPEQDGVSRSFKKVHVVASIVPLTFFVERIGGDRVAVSVMVPPGGNPHSYEPTPGQMVALSNASLFVKAGSGVEFELKWMERFVHLCPSLAVCNASQGGTLLQMKPFAAHPHHTEDTHARERIDPHFWLSPMNGILIASNIERSLSALDPSGASVYHRNFLQLKAELLELSSEIRQTLSGIGNRAFMVFHPAWGYYAAEYGLQQIAAEAEGKALAPKSMVRVIRQARELGIRVVFVSPQFSRVQAQTIAREIGGVTQSVDPLSASYIDNLRQATAAFSRSMQ
ncbi:periplasmic solute binding protein [Prosthecochloris aestuarii DSM 271]|uniref:Periplasmic solute binding protein n=1 Tax=Prosthecochloris aestuarii (strain DSM 271 / SK 413) TaxID=290512 RepID=B4S3P8_PROA2|nr:zinc ABC transporter substrate-binding protein [Prosthecochloris aestuarii]ACF45244.1 periplasmic solute binding protein [Prosthecochloris aestuarii DSM 271]